VYCVQCGFCLRFIASSLCLCCLAVPGLSANRARRPRGSLPPVSHGSAKQCLLLAPAEVSDACWLPSAKEFWEPGELVRSIALGRATGFVTVRGGRESEETVRDDPAGHRFGFCVQKYAPVRGDLGEFTLDQISNYHGWDRGTPQGDAKLDEYLSKLQGRTLCASSFLSEETVSTTYLAWLMAARGFRDFEVTHFLEYRFRDWAADFLGPVLQRRHECKRAGDMVAAECLKLIGNGSYGYNGLEASNYSDVRLMTDRVLQRRYRSDMAHRRIQHITFLGMVRETRDAAAARRRSKRSADLGRRSREGLGFLDLEAGADQDDDDDEDDDASQEEEEAAAAERMDSSSPEHRRQQGPEDPYPDYSPDEDATSSSEDEARQLSYSRHKKLLHRAVSAPSRGSQDEEEAESEVEDGERRSPARVDTQDLEEALVADDEGDENLGAGGPLGRRKKRGRLSAAYRFLYAVTLSGEERQVVNSLPRAVAVLSNSKRLFLGHLECMFRCLDPRKAELCYVDTDSCIWSLSEKTVDLCLRDDRREEWSRANIVADEAGPQSCHGLMKLEGTYRSGIFRTVKMYRLFDGDEQGQGAQPYTRCKGVHRSTASNLKDDVFLQTTEPCQVVVHRSALRPTRAGEIRLTRESKSLAVPFNLKRRVDRSGTHTDCFSPSAGYRPEELPR